MQFDSINKMVFFWGFFFFYYSLVLSLADREKKMELWPEVWCIHTCSNKIKIYLYLVNCLIKQHIDY